MYNFRFLVALGDLLIVEAAHAVRGLLKHLHDQQTVQLLQGLFRQL